MTKSIQIDDKVHQQLKVESAKRGISLQELVEEKLS